MIYKDIEKWRTEEIKLSHTSEDNKEQIWVWHNGMMKEILSDGKADFNCAHF